MEGEAERAEAFLKETLDYPDALDKGMRACACGYPASTEVSALSIRSRAVKHSKQHRALGTEAAR